LYGWLTVLTESADRVHGWYPHLDTVSDVVN